MVAKRIFSRVTKLAGVRSGVLDARTKMLRISQRFE